MATIFESTWFRTIGSIIMIGSFLVYLSYILIRRIHSKYKKGKSIDGLDILLLCAIPSCIAFTWRWIGQLLGLFGIYITYDASAVYPDITAHWLRVFFLFSLLVSVVGATIMFKALQIDAPSEKEKGDRVLRLKWFLIILVVWFFAAYAPLQYMITWICES